MMLEILAYSGEFLASDSDGDGIPIAAVLLLSGFIFYAYVFFRYRNADKRHMHESETESDMLNVEVADEKSGSIRGVSHARMRGANHRSVKGAQQGFSNAGLTQDKISDITGSIFRR